jgi:multisubunit Na+/H+ antiporter MnhF subunit
VDACDVVGDLLLWLALLAIVAAVVLARWMRRLAHGR